MASVIGCPAALINDRFDTKAFPIWSPLITGLRHWKIKKKSNYQALLSQEAWLGSECQGWLKYFSQYPSMCANGSVQY